MISPKTVIIALFIILITTSCQIREFTGHKLLLVKSGQAALPEPEHPEKQKNIATAASENPVIIVDSLNDNNGIDSTSILSTHQFPVASPVMAKPLQSHMEPGDSTRKIEAFSVGAFATAVGVFCLGNPFSNGYSYLLAAIALGLSILSIRRFNRNPGRFKYRILMNIAMIVGLAFTTFLVLMLLQTLISGSL